MEGVWWDRKHHTKNEMFLIVPVRLLFLIRTPVFVLHTHTYISFVILSVVRTVFVLYTHIHISYAILSVVRAVFVLHTHTHTYI